MWRASSETGSAAARDPAFRAYLTDLVRPWGLGLREDLLSQGNGHSYGELAGDLLAGRLPPDEPVGLVVLAFAVHDVEPWRSAACELAARCPGSPVAFAVCDQGVAAPFTGLRIIGEYLRTGGCERAMLMVAEQSSVPYDLAAPAAIPARHAVVALRCQRSGTGRPATVRQHAGLTPAQAATRLAGEIDRHGPDTVMIAGTGLMAGNLLSGARGGRDVLTGPDGQPGTGAWWRLAGLLDGASRGRPALLADYDPLLGDLGICGISVAAAG